MKTSFWKYLVLYTGIGLFKLYNISIILLLENNLINICSEITKIFNEVINDLYLQNERLQEDEKMGKSWMHFASLTKMIRELWL